ncbi:hypothetical protein KC336_g18409 [Hortaea werneckii]|nr:hypothetical protein KC336_g18409 [Hortaea werneckii]
MGDSYYYVTSTGPVFAGQGLWSWLSCFTKLFLAKLLRKRLLRDGGLPVQPSYDEQNPGATWVDGEPEGAPFGDFSASDVDNFNSAFSETFNAQPAFDFARHQTFDGAAPQPESLQIPNRDQRAQRRAQLLADMQRISQELIELEALDAA